MNLLDSLQSLESECKRIGKDLRTMLEAGSKTPISNLELEEALEIFKIGLTRYSHIESLFQKYLDNLYCSGDIIPLVKEGKQVLICDISIPVEASFFQVRTARGWFANGINEVEFS